MRGGWRVRLPDAERNLTQFFFNGVQGLFSGGAELLPRPFMGLRHREIFDFISDHVPPRGSLAFILVSFLTKSRDLEA